MSDTLCYQIKELPIELRKEIYIFIYKKCDICFKKIEFWNVYRMKDIYKVRLENFSFSFVYLFLDNNKELCTYCYSMIKYWFK